MKRAMIVSTLAAALSLPAGLTIAADQQKQVYGSQLMTEQERNEYRARLQNANTVEEREQIRAEHHEEMKKRAQAQGVTLPDKPPAKRTGQGAGKEGMGPGGGMGHSGGQGG